MQPLNIVLVRVDNRLVHGQILEAWVPHFRSTCVIVVYDEAAEDFFYETVIRMALPKEVEAIICSVENFSKNYVYRQGKGKNTIVLFHNIADALRAYEQGFNFAKLNIGNVYDRDCTLCCSRSVFLNDRDIETITRLIYEKGVTVELRGVPREEAVDFREIIKPK